MKKIELFFAAVCIIALTLNIFLFPGGGFLTVISLFFFSMFYFAFSFALLNNIELRNIFKKESYREIGKLKVAGAIFTGFILSIITLGVLFKFQSWPGANFYLKTGTNAILLVAIIAV